MSRRPFSPWYRPRNAVLLVVAIAAIWIGRWVVWAYTARPVASVDYVAHLEAMVDAAQPQGPDARPHLERLMELVDELNATFPADARPERHRHAFDFLAAIEPGVEPDDADAARAALAWLDERGVEDLFAEITACPRLSFLVEAQGGSLIMIELPGLSVYRMLAKERCASMRLALAEGRTDDGIAAAEHVLHLESLLGPHPFLIHALVAQSIGQMAREHVREAVFAHDLDGAALRRLFAAVAAAEATSFGPALEGERAVMLDTIQRTYSDDGRGGGHLLMTEMAMFESGFGTGAGQRTDAPRIVNLVGLFAANRREMTAKANAMYDEIVEHARLTPVERLAAGPLQTGQTLTWRYQLLRLLMPALGKAVDTQDWTALDRATTLVVLAIEIHRREGGALPATLDDLAGLGLDVPLDPISGHPFVYRATPDEPERAYLLYAPDLDGSDPGEEGAGSVVNRAR